MMNSLEKRHLSYIINEYGDLTNLASFLIDKYDIDIDDACKFKFLDSTVGELRNIIFVDPFKPFLDKYLSENAAVHL